MNIRICVPVIGETKESFISNLQNIQKIADYVELRIDYIPNISKEILDEIKTYITTKAIVTCRKKTEGGKFEYDEAARIDILQHAISRFDYVDIELSTLQSHSFVRDEKTKIIVSYHNFESTPGFWELQKIVYDMNQLNPDILKIATMLTKEYEASKIYRLLSNKAHTEERIIIGMGPYGRITRILGPLLGGYLTFASSEYGESAPGQVSIDELKEIYYKLR